MATIEVDFEVFKELTARRETEEVTHNDVIRKLLKLTIGQTHRSGTVSSASRSAWIVKGVTFPADTEFRANYKGKTHLARVEGAALQFEGMPFYSPSSAAVYITKSPVNGWRFWECKFPNTQTWIPIERLRVLD